MHIENGFREFCFGLCAVCMSTIAIAALKKGKEVSPCSNHHVPVVYVQAPQRSRKGAQSCGSVRPYTKRCSKPQLHQLAYSVAIGTFIFCFGQLGSKGRKAGRPLVCRVTPSSASVSLARKPTNVIRHLLSNILVRMHASYCCRAWGKDKTNSD